MRALAFLILVVSSLWPARLFAAENPQYDIVIYGATPGGISAAVAAGRAGENVLLIEPTPIVGGLITNGLSHPDFRSFEAITGIYSEFNLRILDWYALQNGTESKQIEDTFRGSHSEPHVALAIFQQMLAEQPTITVWTDSTLQSAGVEQNRIQAIAIRTKSGESKEVTAKVFIDGSYEGDLMAAAGVPYRVGREARSEYGESLAPETADAQVQGYNFRLTMTDDPAIRVLPDPPAGYDRNDFLPLLELIAQGKITKAFHVTDGGSFPQAIYKIHGVQLPNRKYDINDMSRGLVRLSLAQWNDEWPDGTPAVRQKIFDRHLRDTIGMMYFLQNDEAVPAEFREAAREWGLCRDEFVDNNHLPYQLYVREARRMVGVKVFTEYNVTANSETDVRSKLATDAIAMGDYGPNCHGTAHEGPRFGGKHTGEFYGPSAPYQIPYGVIIPKECENLIVPVACSASHVGFCALRLEPIWISLGQAAGEAAHLANKLEVPVQRVPVPELQQRLHAGFLATIYTSDVGFDSPDFRAVQWWGTLGGFHGLVERTEKYGQRGKNIQGQYFETFPEHAVELETALDASTRKRWLQLAEGQGISTTKLTSAATRKEFLRAAWESRPALSPSEKP